ncbi:hypothetical protein F4818DRAFT_455230 [Hypoxylon cercidicola]|nr:hypothetical protein F4818DRAFT_455230 [Hypoxylon cercidicola]
MAYNHPHAVAFVDLSQCHGIIGTFQASEWHLFSPDMKAAAFNFASSQAPGKLVQVFLDSTHPNRVLLGVLSEIILYNNYVKIEPCQHSGEIMLGLFIHNQPNYQNPYMASSVAPAQLTPNMMSPNIMFPHTMLPNIMSTNTMATNMMPNNIMPDNMMLPSILNTPVSHQRGATRNLFASPPSSFGTGYNAVGSRGFIPNNGISSSSPTSNGEQVRGIAIGAGNPRQGGALVNSEGVPEGRSLPRPRNSWVLYRAVHDQEIAKRLEHRGLVIDGVNRTTLISRILADQWRERLPTVQKEFFIRKAAEEEALHKQTYPDYHYQPGKNESGADSKKTSITEVLPGYLNMESLVREYHQLLRSEGLNIIQPVPDGDAGGYSQYNVPELYGRTLVEPSQQKDKTGNKRKRASPSQSEKARKTRRAQTPTTAQGLSSQHSISPLGPTQVMGLHHGQAPMTPTPISQPSSTPNGSRPILNQPRPLSNQSRFIPDKPRLATSQPTPSVSPSAPIVSRPAPAIQQQAPAIAQPADNPATGPQQPNDDNHSNDALLAFWSRYREQPQQANARHSASSTDGPAPEASTSGQPQEPSAVGGGSTAEPVSTTAEEDFSGEFDSSIDALFGDDGLFTNDL